MQIGTFGYMAPEVLTFANNDSPAAYSVAIDIWAIGVVAVELLLKRHPFSSILDLAGYVHGTRQLDIAGQNGATPSDKCQDFLRRLLSADPVNRPTAKVASRHPWLVERGPSVDREES